MIDGKCICFVTDPSTWDYYNGVADPTSMLEPNYDCPEHFPLQARIKFLEDAYAHEHDLVLKLTKDLNRLREQLPAKDVMQEVSKALRRESDSAS